MEGKAGVQDSFHLRAIHSRWCVLNYLEGLQIKHFLRKLGGNVDSSANRENGYNFVTLLFESTNTNTQHEQYRVIM